MFCFLVFENFDYKKSFLFLFYRRQIINDIDFVSLIIDDLLKFLVDGLFFFICVGLRYRISKKNKKCIRRLNLQDIEKN